MGVADGIGGYELFHVLFAEAGIVADDRDTGVMGTLNGAVGPIGRHGRNDDRLDAGRDQRIDEGRFLADIALRVGFDDVEFAAGIGGSGLDTLADTGIETLRIHIDRADLQILVLRRRWTGGSANGQHRHRRQSGCFHELHVAPPK